MGNWEREASTNKVICLLPEALSDFLFSSSSFSDRFDLSEMLSVMSKSSHYSSSGPAASLGSSTKTTLAASLFFNSSFCFSAMLIWAWSLISGFAFFEWSLLDPWTFLAKFFYCSPRLTKQTLRTDHFFSGSFSSGFTGSGWICNCSGANLSSLIGLWTSLELDLIFLLENLPSSKGLLGGYLPGLRGCLISLSCFSSSFNSARRQFYFEIWFELKRLLKLRTKFPSLPYLTGLLPS